MIGEGLCFNAADDLFKAMRSEGITMDFQFLCSMTLRLNGSSKRAGCR